MPMCQEVNNKIHDQMNPESPAASSSSGFNVIWFADAADVTFAQHLLYAWTTM